MNNLRKRIIKKQVCTLKNVVIADPNLSVVNIGREFL